MTCIFVWTQVVNKLHNYYYKCLLQVCSHLANAAASAFRSPFSRLHSRDSRLCSAPLLLSLPRSRPGPSRFRSRARLTLRWFPGSSLVANTRKDLASLGATWYVDRPLSSLSSSAFMSELDPHDSTNGEATSLVIYANRKISSISCAKSHNINEYRLVLQLSLPNPLQVLSREWRCSWSSADTRCQLHLSDQQF